MNGYSEKEKNVPIRILCIFSTLDRGGAETMCMNLYRHIDRNLVQFDFVKHTQRECAYEKEIRELGGRIYTAPQYRVYNHLAYCKWWKNHYKEHPEHRIIHGHYYTLASVYFKIAKQFGRVTVGHSHNTDFEGNGMQRLTKKMIQRKTEDYSDHCFACSEEAGKWLFPNREFHILNNAIDVEKYRFKKDVREEVRIEMDLTDLFVVGVVGRFERQKNPMGIVDIFKEVHKRDNRSKLLWVGDGALKEEVRRKLKEENLEDSVILTGVRSDVDRLMQAMDVFILPSLFEGLPVTAIEAQAAGLPSFCSDVVSKEVNITELCRFLPLENNKQWADEIMTVKKNSIRMDTPKTIRQAGYDIHKTAKDMQEFYLGH